MRRAPILHYNRGTATFFPADGGAAASSAVNDGWEYQYDASVNGLSGHRSAVRGGAATSPARHRVLAIEAALCGLDRSPEVRHPAEAPGRLRPRLPQQPGRVPTMLATARFMQWLARLASVPNDPDARGRRLALRARSFPRELLRDDVQRGCGDAHLNRRSLSWRHPSKLTRRLHPTQKQASTGPAVPKSWPDGV